MLRVVAVCSIASLSLGNSSIAVDYIHYDYQFVNYTMAVYSLVWPDCSLCGFPQPQRRTKNQSDLMRHTIDSRVNMGLDINKFSLKRTSLESFIKTYKPFV